MRAARMAPSLACAGYKTRKGEYGDTQRQQEAGIRGERKPMWDEESEFTQIKKERYIWLRLNYYSYRWVQVFRRPFQTVIPSEKASMARYPGRESSNSSIETIK